MLTIKPIDNGYYHIRGRGPCNWCQPPRWPATREEIDESMFPEAGAEFRREVHREAERLLEEREADDRDD